MIRVTLVIGYLFLSVCSPIKCMYVDGLKIMSDGVWMDTKTGKMGKLEHTQQSEMSTASEDNNTCAQANFEKKLIVTSVVLKKSQEISTESDSKE